MELLPSIDLRGGRCVRLLKGDFENETRYEIDPAKLALRYARLGAEWLHVVDLDGASDGKPANLDVVEAMVSTSGLRVQLGGGIRSQEDLDRALGVAQRVVLGSLAVTAQETVADWLQAFGPGRVALALDVRFDAAGEPLVATHGWTQRSALTLWDALERFEAHGLKHVLCTDVDRDGALQGPNLALYERCVRRFPNMSFQASGGVRDARDLEQLRTTGVAFAISGKALLEGRLSEQEIRSFLPNG